MEWRRRHSWWWHCSPASRGARNNPYTSTYDLGIEDKVNWAKPLLLGVTAAGVGVGGYFLYLADQEGRKHEELCVDSVCHPDAEAHAEETQRLFSIGSGTMAISLIAMGGVAVWVPARKKNLAVNLQPTAVQVQGRW